MSMRSDAQQLVLDPLKAAVEVLLRLAMIDLVRKKLAYENEFRRQCAITKMLENYRTALELATRIEGRVERECFETRIAGLIGRVVECPRPCSIISSAVLWRPCCRASSSALWNAAGAL